MATGRVRLTVFRFAGLAIAVVLSGHVDTAAARQRVFTFPDQLDACIRREVKDHATGESCAGQHAKACLGAAEQQETVLPEACYREEEKGWIDLIDRYFAQRPPGAKGRRIAAAHRAWTLFREAKCDAIERNFGGPLGRWQGAICRLDEAGRQALTLRRLHEDPER